MSTASNTLEFLYHLILHGQSMLNTLLAKLIKGLVSLIALSIYYLLVQNLSSPEISLKKHFKK